MPADSHCHLNDKAFDEDRDELAQRLSDEGLIYLLNVGYDFPTSIKGAELAGRYPFMYCAIGLHPNMADEFEPSDIDELRKIATRPKVVAIGETGLDYFRNRAGKEAQFVSLRAHLNLARELCLPVIIHCRDAMDDCLKILEEENAGEFGGVMHCFGGTPDDALKALKLGFHISFAGNVTYPKAKNLRESLAVVPGNRLLAETDCPYLSPQKKRGKRNDPSNLRYTLETMAQVREITLEDMERIAVNNFEELFLKQSGEAQVAYKIRNSLYLNVTQSCTNECPFCVRYHSDSVQGHNLNLPKDPTAPEMILAIGDPKEHDEIVFCGYGEPTIRLARIKEVAKWVKANGGRVRLNTNGHGNHLAKRNITPELKGLIDEFSVSLNADDPKIYDKICKPLIENAWQEMVDFIKAAKEAGIDVTATVVAIPDVVDIDSARRFAEDNLGVKFRVRHYNMTG